MWLNVADATAGIANIAALTAARASSIIFLLMLTFLFEPEGKCPTDVFNGPVFPVMTGLPVRTFTIIRATTQASVKTCCALARSRETLQGRLCCKCKQIIFCTRKAARTDLGRLQ